MFLKLNLFQIRVFAIYQIPHKISKKNILKKESQNNTLCKNMKCSGPLSLQKSVFYGEIGSNENFLSLIVLTCSSHVLYLELKLLKFKTELSSGAQTSCEIDTQLIRVYF